MKISTNLPFLLNRGYRIGWQHFAEIQILIAIIRAVECTHRSYSLGDRYCWTSYRILSSIVKRRAFAATTYWSIPVIRSALSPLETTYIIYIYTFLSSSPIFGFYLHSFNRNIRGTVNQFLKRLYICCIGYIAVLSEKENTIYTLIIRKDGIAQRVVKLQSGYLDIESLAIQTSRSSHLDGRIVFHTICLLWDSYNLKRSFRTWARMHRRIEISQKRLHGTLVFWRQVRPVKAFTTGDQCHACSYWPKV